MPLPHLYVDADACPVKNEIYRVAQRHGLSVTLVANARQRIPPESWITLQLVGKDLDTADDWIADHAVAHDVVVTADIPLASRCTKNGAHVVTPDGRRLTEDNVGDALATRDLLSELRSGGERTGGPPPLDQRARSRFLHQLDEAIQGAKRQGRSERTATTPVSPPRSSRS